MRGAREKSGVGNGFTEWTAPMRARAAGNNRSATASQLTFGDRFDLYVKDTYGPMAVMGIGIGAALTQWTTHNPREWGQGFPGYGRRVASGFARNAISHTVALPVAYLDNEDPRRYPSNRHGIWPRVQYAVVHTFVVRNMTGGQMPAYSRVAGIYASAFAANAWYPERSADTHHALVRGSTSMASAVANQVFREFWPDIKKALHFK